MSEGKKLLYMIWSFYAKPENVILLCHGDRRRPTPGEVNHGNQNYLHQQSCIVYYWSLKKPSFAEFQTPYST